MKIQTMTYKFNDEEMLGKAVQSVKPFCKLTKKMDIPTEKQIVGDFADPKRFPGLAGRKWSRLCGFTFKANDGRFFQFVFVPKLRGTLARNQKGLSGWYIWTLNPSDPDNKQVTSIAELRAKYGFDINKFVHSDYFDDYVKKFKSNVSYALNNQVEDLLAHPEEEFEDYRECVRHADAVREALLKIDEVKEYVTPDNAYDDSGNPDYAKGSAPKIGNAKIAYNADKTYDLRNTGKGAQVRELKRRELEKKAAQKKVDAPKDAEDGSSKKSGGRVIFDPSLKHKFGGGRTKKMDAEIFDKYDDYDDDDYR